MVIHLDQLLGYHSSPRPMPADSTIPCGTITPRFIPIPPPPIAPSVPFEAPGIENVHAES